ncbi:hypothetical protein KY290_028135 [Solanum tuberosum]|uniref:Uncharacterized protein n=1 Tax=Solanum tuberosum TaxID=4113 RepID=A0ABQ7UI80_SOLTU|nr:hypothetical protein KY290_028135 [Solanum tuberosum]
MFDISKEENAATANTQQKQEVVVNTERNIIREDETKCYHEKTYDDPTVYSECDKLKEEFNDSVSPDINVQIDRLNEEKHEIMSVGNAFGGSGEADETMEMNSHIRDTASQHSEDTPQVANVAKAADNASVHTVEQTGPTKFTSAVNNHEEMENGIVARRVEKSCSTELTDKCILQLGTFKSGNDMELMMQGSDEWNVGITRSKEQIGSELLVIEDSDVQFFQENKSLENPKLEADKYRTTSFYE